MNIFLISALRQLGLLTLLDVIHSQEAKNPAYLSLVRPHLEYAAAAWDPYTILFKKISSNLNEFNVVLPVLSKKIYRHTTSVTGLLDELGSNVANTLVWRFSTRRWITFRSFLGTIFQFHHGILEPPVKINLCHCQFVLMSSNIHFSSDHYRLEFPSTACSPLAVDSVLLWGSAELGILQSLLMIMTFRR